MPRGTPRRSSTVSAMDGIPGPSGSGQVALDDPKYGIATSILQSMLHEVVLDTAIETHGSVTRQRKRQGLVLGGCPVCRKTCRDHDEHDVVAAQGSLQANAQGETGESSAQGAANKANGATSNGTGTPTSGAKGLEMYHNNPLLACIVCSRQVSANRYAQHLASCVGVGKGAGVPRRKTKYGGGAGSSAGAASGGPSSAAAKIRLALENRKRASYPLAGSVSRSRTSTPAPVNGMAASQLSASASQPTSMLSRSPLGNQANAEPQTASSSPSPTKSMPSQSLNANGKRSASPSADGADVKKARLNTPPMGRQQHAASLVINASQPAMASPLNPNRRAKSSAVEGDSDDEDEFSKSPAGDKSHAIQIDDDDDDDDGNAVDDEVSMTMHKRVDAKGGTDKHKNFGGVPSSSQPGTSVMSGDDEDEEDDSDSYSESGNGEGEDSQDDHDSADSPTASRKRQRSDAADSQRGADDDDEEEEDEDDEGEDGDDGDEGEDDEDDEEASGDDDGDDDDEDDDE